jgi:tungstate transport system permease protein
MDLIWQGLVAAVRLLLRADPELLRITVLSLGVSLSATLLATATGVPAGVALAVRQAGESRRGAWLQTLVYTGMALPPVVVGLAVSLLLWRTGPLGALRLIYTPSAMVLAQLVVAAPIAAGLTRAGVAALDPELLQALRIDGASGIPLGRELVRAALPQVLAAVAAAFGRAVAEVGASLMVGGNILGQTRILTTAIALETSRGDFALAIALGLVLLLVAFAVNAALQWLEHTATR